MIPLTIICIALIVVIIFQEGRHSRERRELMNRIQAPEVVISRIETEGPTHTPKYVDEEAPDLDGEMANETS